MKFGFYILTLFTKTMNLSISSVAISEDGSGLAIALDHSFQAYTSYPLKRVYHKEFVNFTITHIAITDNGELIAFSCIPMSGDRTIRKVLIWSNTYGECLSQLDFKDDIIELVLRPEYLLVVLSSSVCLYDIKRKLMHLEMVTALNPYGAADISLNSEMQTLCVCGLNDGEVKIIEINNETDPLTFKAHQHQISCVRFNRNGSVLVTSGQTGTIIRLFDTVTGSLLSVLRRGNLAQRIVSMAISQDDTKVVVVSASGTIHLFDGRQRKKNVTDAPRAYAKCKMEKCNFASSTFNSDDDLVVLFSTGHLMTLKCTETTMEVSNKCFLLAH